MSLITKTQQQQNIKEEKEEEKKAFIDSGEFKPNSAFSYKQVNSSRSGFQHNGAFLKADPTGCYVAKNRKEQEIIDVLVKRGILVRV